MTSEKSKPQISENRGFALVVTLCLMVLLTVVAVGLLSLSSITLRSLNHTSGQAEARQNARLALILAIGELQKAAGPDQRMTATADIAGDSVGLPLTAGATPLNDKSVNDISKGLSAVQSGTRYWTGVWKNSAAPATAGTEIYSKTPSPQLVQWLVSSNDPATTGTPTPSWAACSVGSDGTVSDPKTAVVLVGKNTAGEGSSVSHDRYVAAPLVQISTMKGSTVRPSGRYGWWIGDEGVKARINIPATVIANTSYASLSPQRRGWETVAGFENYPLPLSGDNPSIAKVITLPEAGLLVPGVTGASGGVSPLQSVFHSATVDSRGLLTDTLNGGTKVDLTAILSSGALPITPLVPTIPNYPIKGGRIIPRPIGRFMAAPTWDALKEFHDRSKSLESGSLVVKAAASNAAASVAPLVTDLRVLVGIKFSPGPTGTGFKATGCAKVAFAIANPYSKPLVWKNDLEIELQDMTPPGNRPTRIWALGDNAPFFDQTKASVFNKAFFRIGPGTLAPGEARAYTLAGYTLRPYTTAMPPPRVVIDLAPFGSANPSDFTRCVEQDANGVYTSFPPLYALESWQTTLMAMEMRLAGSSSTAPPLRRIERFELDNAYYPATTRNTNYVYPTDYQQRTKPIPLLCYNFQLSQPGVDYLGQGMMPAGYTMGQRGSTLRTFADFNLQATRIGKPIASYTPPPYFMEVNDSAAQLPDTIPGGITGPAFTKNLDSVMPWGRSWTGSKNTVLFGVPDQFVSLAQFQHADLTGDDFAASIGHQAGNAFANSHSTPFLKRDLTIQARHDYEIIGTSNLTGVRNYQTNPMGVATPSLGARNYYDISHLLNTAMWDSYFLSSIPTSGVLTPENPALVLLTPPSSPAKLKHPVTCASELMIDGAFNVNSTDKDAWKTFLASSKHFTHKADIGTSTNAAFPRTLEQTSPAVNPPTGSDADSFAGFRRLTDSELDLLAAEIVKQVRLRGPFVSLSHFVNRALSDLQSSPALSRSGALQTAIDESGLTINFDGDKMAFTQLTPYEDRLNLSEKSNGYATGPSPDMDGTDTTYQFVNADPAVQDWATVSQDNNYGSVASILADRTMLNTDKKEQGYRSTGIPGWLTQADVLQVIGPSIATRSDTFRIRAYGESIDANGNGVAKAYCEAIIQRMPSYVDPINAPSVRGAALSDVNKTHGRKFHIVSFRWLSPQEI